MTEKKTQKSVVFFYNDYESLGLGYISAVLKANGIKASLVYRNLVDYYAFDSSETCKKKLCSGIAPEICRRKPDVLALSLLTDTFQVNMTIAAHVKRINPDIKVLAGGVHASLLPELTLKYPQVDAVAVGEGEFSTLNYIQNLDAISSGASPVIKGIVYKQGSSRIGDIGSYIINDDLDILPYPDKDIFYDEDPSMKSHYFVQCSRGCPFTCSFCINDRLHSMVGGKRFRYRSPENIINELVTARERYSFSYVAFVDECFGFDLKWARSFLTLYKEKIGVPFLVSVHPNVVTPELADLMRDANCSYVAMGVQSLNEESSRTVLKRSILQERVARSIDIIRSRGMILQCDHIFGIPGEDRNDMVKALSFYNEHRPSLVSVYWLSYYPGACITRIAEERGIISKQDIKDIENGRIGLGIKSVQGYYDINFWMNYFIFFKKGFIRWLLRTGFFRFFKIKNMFISSALPRAIYATFHKRDWNRYYMKRIIFKKINNLKIWRAS